MYRINLLMDTKVASMFGCCKQCCYEHWWGVGHVSFRISAFYFSGYIPRSGIAGSYGNSVFKLVVLAALGLCCSAQAVPCCAQLFLAHSCSLHTAVPCCAQLSLAAHRLSLVVVCGVYSLVVVGGCLTVVASLVAEHRL